MKQKLVLLLALSLLVPLHVSGNPGGVGNSLENMQCGGACHGAVSYTHLTLPTT